MASSEVEIWNVALVRAGVSYRVASPNEDSTEAAVCRSAYPLALDDVLVSVPWPFATRRASLSALTGGERSGWTYAYALPADCLQVRDIWTGVRNPPVRQRIPFALEHDPVAGKILLTNQASPEIIYTTRIDAPGLFPPGFVDALAWRLAQDVGYGLSAKEQILAQAQRGYMVSLSRAAAQVMGEERRDQPPDSEFISGRW